MFVPTNKKKNSMGRATEYVAFLNATPKEFTKLNKQHKGAYFFWDYITPTEKMKKLRRKHRRINI